MIVVKTFNAGARPGLVFFVVLFLDFCDLRLVILVLGAIAACFGYKGTYTTRFAMGKNGKHYQLSFFPTKTARETEWPETFHPGK